LHISIFNSQSIKYCSKILENAPAGLQIMPSKYAGIPTSQMCTITTKPLNRGQFGSVSLEYFWIVLYVHSYRALSTFPFQCTTKMVSINIDSNIAA